MNTDTDSDGPVASYPVPELVPETADDVGEPSDLTFTPGQWARLSLECKRSLAAAADSDVVHGRSTKLEIRAYFVTQADWTWVERE